MVYWKRGCIEHHLNIALWKMVPMVSQETVLEAYSWPSVKSHGKVGGRILSIRLLHRHHLPLNVIRLLLGSSPHIMDPGPWVHEDRVGVSLWPLVLYQEKMYESF